MVGLEGMESRTLEVTIVSTEVVQSVKCMSWWEKLKRERRKKRVELCTLCTREELCTYIILLLVPHYVCYC